MDKNKGAVEACKDKNQKGKDKMNFNYEKAEKVTRKNVLYTLCRSNSMTNESSLPDVGKQIINDIKMLKCFVPFYSLFKKFDCDQLFNRKLILTKRKSFGKHKERTG